MQNKWASLYNILANQSRFDSTVFDSISAPAALWGYYVRQHIFVNKHYTKRYYCN
jgi:hypothetical protein